MEINIGTVTTKNNIFLLRKISSFELIYHHCFWFGISLLVAPARSRWCKGRGKQIVW